MPTLPSNLQITITPNIIMENALAVSLYFLAMSIEVLVNSLLDPLEQWSQQTKLKLAP